MKSVIFAFAVVVAVGAVDIADILRPEERAANDQFVAFSAGLTQTTSIAANITLKFDKVWTNTGNAYDNTTGVFTCPQAGAYMFIYHSLSETAGTMWVDLYKGGDYQVTAFAHNVNDYADASNSIVLQLNAGEQVYLRARGTDTIYGATDEIYSTFSGFLLASQH